MHFPTTLLLLVVLFVLTYSQSPKYQEKYITVPIDHFNFVNEKSFQLRYLINDTYTRGNLSAPILFYCGNEANIEFFAKETGLLWELGPKLRALIVFAEGRYFGKSLPFGSDSMNGREHYGYLTIEQTLADFAALLTYLNGNGALRRPAIAIGGSHGGVLAAFLRMKYPDLVAGALASSAPMRKFSNLARCDVYSKIITNVFENAYSSYCTSNIKKSWTVLKAIAGGPKGVEIFNDIFKFCHPWTSSNQVDDLLNSIEGMYWKMSQTNYPYPADYYTPLPANPVRAFCAHLDTEFDGLDLVKALHKALNVYTNHDGKKHCFEFPTRQTMKPLDLAAFEFQRCSEIIMAFCSDGKQDMFRPVNETFESVVENCKRQYGIRVDQDVNRIKIHFGVDHLKTVTNTIFSNGLLDPWSGASILVAPNDQVTIINIPEAAHHLDLRYSNELDPESVIEARKLEAITMRKWIKQFGNQQLL